jgi:hypothetical protein
MMFKKNIGLIISINAIYITHEHYSKLTWPQYIHKLHQMSVDTIMC